MDKNSALGFGKYRNRTIKDVWIGEIKFNKSIVIKTYLQEFFDFLTGAEQQGIAIPIPSVDPDTFNEVLKRFRTNPSFFKICVANKRVVIETMDKELQRSLNAFIINFLSGTYRDIHWMPPHTVTGDLWSSYSDNSIEFLNLQGNPKYISWCIYKFDSFFINPDDLYELKTMQSKYLDTFRVTPIKEDLIQYEPVFKVLEYEFPVEMEEINQQKFNDHLLSM